ncbi:MAG: hypothetical protein E7052_05625 [Lentisphaerae bacterium]|nr:hypothetical protein [Lentisphaerota bacterium]
MKMKKNNFTLFELLISVGLLVILAVVLLRTFMLTADYWKFSAEQSETYIDAKIVMAQLNEDISNMLYEKDPTSVADEIAVPLYSGSFNLSYSAVKLPGSNTPKGWCLGMVSRQVSSESGDETLSNICKIAYIYYPPAKSGSVDISGLSSAEQDKINGKENGVLLRGYITEDTDNYLKGGETIQNFYSGAMSNVRQLSDGIIDFKIEPYKKSGSSFAAVDYTAGSKEGLKGVDALRLSMTVMPTDKLTEYKKLLDDNAADAELTAFIHKHGRKFTRTYWVNAFGQ